MSWAFALRTFRPGDQDEVRSLIVDGLRERWPMFDDRMAADLADISASYGDGRTVVVEVDGSIVGTGTVVLRDGSTAEILRMSVSRRTRRTGLGRLIVESLIETAREWGAARVVLETTSGWSDAVAFYLSCGFTITHHQDGPLGEDTWFELRL
jgi:GNAT superfamily N-acetyltransferase